MFDFFYDGRKTFQMSLVSAGVILLIYAIYTTVNYQSLSGESPIFLEFPSTISMIAYYGLFKPVALFLFALTALLLGTKFSVDDEKFNLFSNVVLSCIGIYFFIFFILRTAYPVTKDINNISAVCALLFMGIGFKFLIPATYFSDRNDCWFDFILHALMYVIMFFITPIIAAVRSSFIPVDPLLFGVLCLASAIAWRIVYPIYLEISYRDYVENRQYLGQQEEVCPTCKRTIN